MKISSYVILLLFCLPVSSFCQVDSSALFKKSRKTLSHPVAHFKKLINADSIHEQMKNNLSVIHPYEGNIYYGDQEDSVRAIFEGTVISVFKTQAGYGVITRFGNYFITYSDINTPLIKKGDYIGKGQYIGNVAMTIDKEYMLYLTISTKDFKYLDPMKWMK